MRSGALRHLVTIQQPSREKQAGTVATTWMDYQTCRASIEVMKSYDKAAAQTTMPGADVTITMRWVPWLRPDMRIVHGEMIYSILGQPNNVDGRNRELILTCQSGVKAQ
ncbi:phage head closure protein [Geomonas nitrogeniifigens]|uniref:phage head closure protein n=1 Tax=Geomonas diazotrophica TaxID=2843197 RepID=UPI001C2C8508|nr:phage head closure protein [Geomonas nitrogeniifigens]QXE85973.1 phage head closure protein [Geomonas nitrogeniifigens]